MFTENGILSLSNLLAQTVSILLALHDLTLAPFDSIDVTSVGISPHMTSSPTESTSSGPRTIFPLEDSWSQLRTMGISTGFGVLTVTWCTCPQSLHLTVESSTDTDFPPNLPDRTSWSVSALH